MMGTTAQNTSDEVHHRRGSAWKSSMRHETVSLQSRHSSGDLPRVVQQQRRRRFGSACQVQFQVTTKRSSMGFRSGRPSIISFRSSSAETETLNSPASIPDLMGSSSSSIDDYSGGNCISPAASSKSLQQHLIHEKTQTTSIQRRFLKRWTQSVLLIVSQTTKTTVAFALNSLLDILFLVLSTLFALIETTAVFIQQNQSLKYFGNGLIRFSAFMIHSTRRKRPESSSPNHQQPQQPRNNRTDPRPASPTRFRRRTESPSKAGICKRSRDAPAVAMKRNEPPLKRGLFRRKPQPL